MCIYGLRKCAETHILQFKMSLSAEIADLERSLREADVPLDGVITSAGINRSTWTRWKNGSVQGARYDAIARVRAAADAAIKSKRRRAPKGRAA